MFHRRRAVQTLLAAPMLVSSWPAAALPSPKSKVILILGGRIGEHNAAGLAQFDLAMIEALEQRSFTTMTPWSRQQVRCCVSCWRSSGHREARYRPMRSTTTRSSFQW